MIIIGKEFIQTRLDSQTVGSLPHSVYLGLDRDPLPPGADTENDESELESGPSATEILHGKIDAGEPIELSEGERSVLEDGLAAHRQNIVNLEDLVDQLESQLEKRLSSKTLAIIVSFVFMAKE